MSVFTLLFTSFVFGQATKHCASMYEHHSREGAEYKIIVDAYGETTNFRGAHSMCTDFLGYGKKCWWDDRVSSFYVQPGCQLRLHCGYDRNNWGPYSTYFMSEYNYDNTVYNLINSWNDCVSKFECSCDFRRLEDANIDLEQQDVPGLARRATLVNNEELFTDDMLVVLPQKDSAPADDSAFVLSETEEQKEDEREREDLAHRVVAPVLAKIERDIEQEIATQLREMEREGRRERAEARPKRTQDRLAGVTDKTSEDKRVDRKDQQDRD